jgi:hypothetical protein
MLPFITIMIMNGMHHMVATAVLTVRNLRTVILHEIIITFSRRLCTAVERICGRLSGTLYRESLTPNAMELSSRLMFSQMKKKEYPGNNFVH